MTIIGPRLLMLVPLLGACESLEERAQYLTGPEAIVWTSDEDFAVQGQDDMKGHINATNSSLHVYLTGFPPGTVVSVGDQTNTVRSNGAANIEAPVTSLFGRVSTEDFLAASIEGVGLTLRPPGREPFSVALPAQDVSRPDAHLLSIVNGALLYAGEETNVAARPPGTIYWPHGASHDLVGAPAETFGDIDAIATMEHVVSGIRVCSGYQGSGGGSRELTLELVEHVVRVYDRRTGTSLMENRFAPIDRCPDSAFTFEGQAFRTQTVLPEDDIRTWLQAQVAQ